MKGFQGEGPPSEAVDARGRSRTLAVPVGGAFGPGCRGTGTACSGGATGAYAEAGREGETSRQKGRPEGRLTGRVSKEPMSR